MRCKTKHQTGHPFNPLEKRKQSPKSHEQVMSKESVSFVYDHPASLAFLFGHSPFHWAVERDAIYPWHQCWQGSQAESKAENRRSDSGPLIVARKRVENEKTVVRMQRIECAEGRCLLIGLGNHWKKVEGKDSKNPLASQVPTHEWNDGTIQEDFLRPGHDDKWYRNI